jgi:2-hydroxy-6-oxonona-2,4-dienedioate hydrolase
MSTQHAIEERWLTVQGKPAHVYVGGQGEPLLLVHGGWGGAPMHWAPVWEQLAKRFLVIAPDLPGVGRTDQQRLGTLEAYAQWLEGLLEALEVPSAWCVGNSFGASIVWALGSRSPARCRGLVLVNGIPMPPTPPFLLWAGTGLATRVMRAVMRRFSYTPSALSKAFVHPERAPAELHAVLHHPSPPQLHALVEVLVHGGLAASPQQAPLFLWGEEDRLLGSDVHTARKLHARHAGSRLALIPAAGHFPQMENPSAFIDALTSFIGTRATTAPQAAATL